MISRFEAFPVGLDAGIGEERSFDLGHRELIRYLPDHPQLAHTLGQIEDTGTVVENAVIDTMKNVGKTIFEAVKNNPGKVAAGTAAVVVGIGTAAVVSSYSPRA
jgi:hypothetical protein